MTSDSNVMAFCEFIYKGVSAEWCLYFDFDYIPAVPAKLTGHPDTWHDGAGEEFYFENVTIENADDVPPSIQDLEVDYLDFDAVQEALENSMRAKLLILADGFDPD